MTQFQVKDAQIEGENMPKIEEKVVRYNQIKTDLLKIVKCIDCCNENEKDLYQNIAAEYSKELRRLKESIENVYGIELCGCCLSPIQNSDNNRE